MPGKLKVRIVAGRNLPVMDRSSELTDAFVEVKFGQETQKTDVCRKSLDPQWNSEWFRFEVDDEELQDEPLQIRVLDHDTYSSHDAIGKLYIDLDPLLNKGNASIISGWFPIYDTMHGIRGELHVVVKVELFTDFNRFKQSSCGVQFFCTSGVPAGFRVQAMQGFVEELVVNDDPEYQWIDKIRSMRASNEARQLQFSKLTGELQRKIGLKVLEMGGNSVIGYHQCFDLEGESGLTVRAIGTSVLLHKYHSASPHPDSQSPGRELNGPPPSAPAVLLQPNFASRPRLHSLPLVPTIHRFPQPPYHPLPSPSYLNPASNPCCETNHNLELEGVHGVSQESALTVKGSSVSAGNPPQNVGENANVSPKSSNRRKKLSLPWGGVHSTEVRIRGERHASGEYRKPQDGVFDFSVASPHTAGNTSHLSGSGALTHAQYSPASVSPTGAKVSSSPVKMLTNTGLPAFNQYGRRSSESDLSTPPRGSSMAGSSGSAGGSASKQYHLPQQRSIDLLEYPFFTIKSFPENVIVHLGGVVSARSVKLLDKIHNPDEPETRDVWWTELRTEIRSHTKAMACCAVVGYVEATTICDEIIILSASGTAAVVNMDANASLPPPALLHLSGDSPFLCADKITPGGANVDQEKSGSAKKSDVSKKLHVDVNLANQDSTRHHSAPGAESGERAMCCRMTHVPYNEHSLPFPVTLSRCAVCRQHKVPDVLFSTVEYMREVPIVGKGCFLQARICRAKREARGESNAKEISDALKFMEYDLHNQLLNKLKIKGMNMLYGLRITFCVGDKLLVAVATATGVYASSLPAPAFPQFSAIKKEVGKRRSSMEELERRVTEAVHASKDLYQLYPPDWLHVDTNTSLDECEDEALPDVDFAAGNKESFVLQVDDAEDADQLSVLLDPPSPPSLYVCTTEVMPGVPNVVCNLQTFTKMWRGQLSLASNKVLSNIFNHIIRSIYFKLRKMTPCVLCHLDFDIDLPEDDEIQISVTGICAGLGEPASLSSNLVFLADTAKTASQNKTGDEDDMMFDIEINVDGTTNQDVNQTTRTNQQQANTRQSSAINQSASSSQGLGVPSKGQAITPRHSPLPKRSSLQYKGPAAIKMENKLKYHKKKRHTPAVELSPLCYIPAASITSHLGHLNFFIVRESTSVREEGGLNGFLHSFVGEVMAICRSHVAALGGNALVAYQMSECVVEDNLHKNQSQCLVNVYGDVVQVVYESDAPTIAPVVPMHLGTSK